MPESRTLAARAERGIVTVPTDTAPMRILSRRGEIRADEGPSPRAESVVIQVGRSEAPMRQELGQLLLILVLGLPLGSPQPAWAATRWRVARCYPSSA